eukprot:scaffold30792_cov63-Phaeocystis_antarctica.AAC.7
MSENSPHGHQHGALVFGLMKTRQSYLIFITKLTSPRATEQRSQSTQAQARCAPDEEARSVHGATPATVSPACHLVNVMIYSSSSSLDTLGGPAPRWKSASQSLLDGQWRRNRRLRASTRAPPQPSISHPQGWRWALLLGPQGSPAQVDGAPQAGGWPHGLLQARARFDPAVAQPIERVFRLRVLLSLRSRPVQEAFQRGGVGRGRRRRGAHGRWRRHCSHRRRSRRRSWHRMQCRGCRRHRHGRGDRGGLCSRLCSSRLRRRRGTFSGGRQRLAPRLAARLLGGLGALPLCLRLLARLGLLAAEHVRAPPPQLCDRRGAARVDRDRRVVSRADLREEQRVEEHVAHLLGEARVALPLAQHLLHLEELAPRVVEHIGRLLRSRPRAAAAEVLDQRTKLTQPRQWCRGRRRSKRCRWRVAHVEGGPGRRRREEASGGVRVMHVLQRDAIRCDGGQHDVPVRTARRVAARDAACQRVGGKA